MSKVTAEAIAAYLREHPGAETADLVAHFKVSDSYIRRKKREAAASGLLGAEPGAAASGASPAPVGATGAGGLRGRRGRRPRSSYLVKRLAEQKTQAEQRGSKAILLRPGMVARAGTMWLCRFCDQLMPVLPGTKSADWNKTGCYLHATPPPPSPPNPLQAADPPADPPVPPVPVLTDPGVAGAPSSDRGTIALETYKAAVPVPVAVPGSRPVAPGAALRALGDSSAARRRAAVKDNGIGLVDLLPYAVRLAALISRWISPGWVLALVLVGLLILWSLASQSGVNPWSR